jgi:hypothetical protein
MVPRRLGLCVRDIAVRTATAVMVDGRCLTESVGDSAAGLSPLGIGEASSEHRMGERPWLASLNRPGVGHGRQRS